MSDIRLIAQVCMHNEVEKGNLDRCLDNLRQYCDEIVIYDDASTDDSVNVALKYTPHIIRGEVNNQMQELAHKQVILGKALEIGATHLFWLDCDEILERNGTLGGLRVLCENWPDNIDAFSFRELNLWRSQTWIRTDSLFTKTRFVRLWKAIPNMSFSVKAGVHLRLYPGNIKSIREAPFGVIHYGFHDYKKMMVKIGAHGFNRRQLWANAETNWILNETECCCYRTEDDIFPPGCLPPDVWARPKPKRICELVRHSELLDEPPLPLADCRCLAEWTQKHHENYHGSYQEILDRNRRIWEGKVINPDKRIFLFQFNPMGKTIFDVASGGGWFMLDCLINGAAKVIGLEIDSGLVEMARRSFLELGVPVELYDFVDLSLGVPELPQADLIYCLAMLMHIPFWQATRYFQWFYDNLKPGGEAHLQFYQAGDGLTMFFNGIDTVSTIRMENELARAGLSFRSKFMPMDEGVLPLWQMYTCVKEEA